MSQPAPPPIPPRVRHDSVSSTGAGSAAQPPPLMPKNPALTLQHHASNSSLNSTIAASVGGGGGGAASFQMQHNRAASTTSTSSATESLALAAAFPPQSPAPFQPSSPPQPAGPLSRQPSANVTNTNVASAAANSPNPDSMRKRAPSDFEFGDVLGEGSYSTVVLAKEKSTSRYFAVKILEKKHIIKEKKVKYVNTEKDVLNRVNHPFFVRLFYTFQDVERLYFVISFAANGELLTTIKKLGSFDERCAQFYAAEIVVALEYLHNLGVIHRDLKPENILLDTDMHIKITDFGSAYLIGQDAETDVRANSFVGTAEYVSPELLTEKIASKASDWWALGCIIYQMLAGRPPFRAGNEYQTFQKITKLDYSIPNGFPPAARDLVEKLLVLDSSKRLGSDSAGGVNAIKSHPFFRGLEWNSLHMQQPPALVPYLPPISRNSVPLHSVIRDDDDEEAAPLQSALESFTLTAPERAGMRSQLLLRQAQESQWHRFVQVDELIIKTGIIHKRKGLFSKRRQLVLTDKPRCLYIDVDKMEIKGEIPWSTEMRFEVKNKKTFFIHTPNRTYYLEDLSADAYGWCEQFNALLKQYRATIAAGMHLRQQQNLDS
ncbi:PkB kinase [Capsaspora owczarzaki ATCC 30864]|uniref:non-specific serine/threonine protein kinase n=1 Tax=Capsaspora owczarzaki (strain ATCC 30864) TaxID=595528 RepID=A0A0D2WRZ9_CAPO3|nr:PkB kinase [Capsaspora owczarzaki ATCC 30864]KJE94855.1 AGC/PDK1 protein kinase [Capsaspora owczarzaki ATCC 30864]|eukprot:XP_004346099.1 PkB kinase [Capsaspora owczarzaki ATCC 30864]